MKDRHHDQPESRAAHELDNLFDILSDRVLKEGSAGTEQLIEKHPETDKRELTSLLNTLVLADRALRPLREELAKAPRRGKGNPADRRK